VIVQTGAARRHYNRGIKNLAKSTGKFNLTITEPPGALTTVLAFVVLVVLILWLALFLFR